MNDENSKNLLQEKSKNYVCGFIFDLSKSQILLLEKNRGPAINIGKFNAVGGKIKAGETPLNAMVRECKEETGLDLQNWYNFCSLSDKSKTWNVEFFYTRTNQILNYRQIEDEVLQIFNINDLPPNLAGNLYWLVPMATFFKNNHCEKLNIEEIDSLE